MQNINEELLHKAKARLARFSRKMSASSIETAAAAALATAVEAASKLRPAADGAKADGSEGTAPPAQEDGPRVTAESDARSQVRVRTRPIVAQAATLAPPKPAAADAAGAADAAPLHFEIPERLTPPKRLDEPPPSVRRRRPTELEDRAREAPVLNDRARPAVKLEATSRPAAHELGRTVTAADTQLPTMKIFGVGGGGGNTVARIPAALSAMLHGMGEAADATAHATLEMCLLNTDTQALALSEATATQAASDAAAAAERCRRSSAATDAVAVSALQLGAETLRGLGAGGVPERARRAAEEQSAAIRTQLGGADLVFLTAGMGGGTGSGAAPVVARLAKESGALVVAVVSTPFTFEGGARHEVAQAAIEELGAHTDVLVVVHNERLGQLLPPDLPLTDTMHAADEVARQAIVGVASMLASSQTINVDFADVQAVMRGAGRGLISIGRADGEGAAQAAVEAALSSPLLDVKLEECGGLAYSVTGGAALTLHQVQAVGEALTPILKEDAKVIFGASIDPSLPADEVIVSLIATGFAPPPPPPPRRAPPSSPPSVASAPGAPPLDLFAYHPPQPKLQAREGASIAEESLRRYDEYLCERTHGRGSRPEPCTELGSQAAPPQQPTSRPSATGGAAKPEALTPTAEERAAAARWYNNIVAQQAKAARLAHEAAHDGKWGI